MRILLILVSIIATSLSTTVNAGPFDGKYRLDKTWDCKNVGVDGGAMRIGKGLFEGVSSSCTMNNPTKIRGMSGMLYDLDCSTRDGDFKERMLFIFQDHKLFILSDTGNSTWQICPPK